MGDDNERFLTVAEILANLPPPAKKLLKAPPDWIGILHSIHQVAELRPLEATKMHKALADARGLHLGAYLEARERLLSSDELTGMQKLAIRREAQELEPVLHRIIDMRASLSDELAELEPRQFEERPSTIKEPKLLSREEWDKKHPKQGAAIAAAPGSSPLAQSDGKISPTPPTRADGTQTKVKKKGSGTPPTSGGNRRN